MVWLNFLPSLRTNLLRVESELWLVLLSVAWLALRLLGALQKRVEKGKLVRIKLFGKEFVEVSGNSNSDPKLGEKNI